MSTMQEFKVNQERASAARSTAKYLRELHGIATCGLPMRFTGIHYGNARVRESIARRVADMYLVWAAEYDLIAEGIERDLEAALGAVPKEGE